MDNYKPLAPADETLIQFLKMGSDLVNRRKNAQLEMTSSPENQNLLLDDTFSIGSITLRAKNYVNLSGFYRTVLGLEVLSNDRSSTTLGRGSTPLLHIKDGQVLTDRNKQAPGLFNFALLYQNSSTLASVLTRVNYYHPELFRGATYNGVSTNFYLEDPEGNGIKLYVDKKPSSWKWLGNTIQVNPQPIDQTEFLKYHFNETIDETWDKQPVKVGHVHLQVPSMAKAKEFYNDLFGLNTTLDLPSVNFYSSNNYHQHITVNTWNSRGVSPVVSKGVEEIQILVSESTYLSALKRKLENSPLKSWNDKSGRLLIVDPSTLIRFEVKLISAPKIIVQD